MTHWKGITLNIIIMRTILWLILWVISYMHAVYCFYSQICIIYVILANIFSAPPYKFQKVCQKTSRTLQYERPENTWEGNYRRRSNHFQCGYYSVPNEPYKNLGGDFDLDPYDLVINTLTENLSPKVRTVIEYILMGILLWYKITYYSFQFGKKI